MLLNSLDRAPLRLLGEMDVRLRGQERAVHADPHDPEAREALSRSQRRIGPPDQEHNWRFNGKGWFTRPQWNGGRCPANSEPTQHNTCISRDDQDKQHYGVKPEEEEEHDDPQDRSADRWKRRAEIARTPEVENSPIFTKPGSNVNWDHPHGPRIYTPYENEKPRPLPTSPEHLPSGLTREGPIRGWRGAEHQKERDRLVKHYTDQGFDEKYVRSALGPRERHASITGMSDTDVARLPDRQGVVRAARKKLVKDRRRDAADYETYVQRHIDNYGYPPYQLGDDDDDDDYDRYDYDERPETIGGYKNHPGYPGHPDYPEFDGRSAELEKPERTRGRRWPSSWDPPIDDEPEDPDSPVTGPHHRGAPRWPRTGERQNPSDIESPDQFETPGSGRKRGSNRTSGRSYMGGGRGRTNFRRRGGRRN